MAPSAPASTSVQPGVQARADGFNVRAARPDPRCTSSPTPDTHATTPPHLTHHPHPGRAGRGDRDRDPGACRDHATRGDAACQGIRPLPAPQAPAGAAPSTTRESRARHVDHGRPRRGIDGDLDHRDAHLRGQPGRVLPLLDGRRRVPHLHVAADLRGAGGGQPQVRRASGERVRRRRLDPCHALVDRGGPAATRSRVRAPLQRLEPVEHPGAHRRRGRSEQRRQGGHHGSCQPEADLRPDAVHVPRVLRGRKHAARARDLRRRMVLGGLQQRHDAREHPLDRPRQACDHDAGSTRHDRRRRLRRPDHRDRPRDRRRVERVALLPRRHRLPRVEHRALQHGVERRSALRRQRQPVLDPRPGHDLPQRADPAVRDRAGPHRPRAGLRVPA